MYYTVSSLIIALENTRNYNGKIRYVGLEFLKCPIPGIIPAGDDNVPCVEDLENCIRGSNGECLRKVEIIDESKNPKIPQIVLWPSYRISRENPDGFIDGDDTPLKIAIRRGYVSVDLLQEI